MYTATCKMCQPVVTTNNEDYTKIVEFIAVHKQEVGQEDHEFMLAASGPKADQMIEGFGLTRDGEK